LPWIAAPILCPFTCKKMSLFNNYLYSTRLCLRKLEEDDLPLIIEWSKSKEFCGDYLTPEHYDVLQLHQQLEAGALWHDHEKYFLVELKETGKPIGTVHYWQPSGKRDTVTMALKVALTRERGKGYGTEIQKFVIIYVFDQLQMQAIEMYTDINNKPQQRCLTKLGFELIESLNYDDQQEKRVGHLYRLTLLQYKKQPVYKFHYE